MTYDLVVMGEVLIELSATEPLTTAERFRLAFSGDALNAAAAAAAAGARVALLTRVGDDEIGHRLLAFLTERGIDTALARPVHRPNGAYLIGADPGGTRDFVYLRTGSAASTMDPGDVAAAGLDNARAVLLSGIAAAISPSSAAAVRAAARTVHDSGGLVLYDPNFRRRLTSPEDARKALADVAAMADLVFPSCPADSMALLGTADPVEAARACRHLGARAAAVTCGADGVVLDDGDTGPTHVPAVPPPAVVDATGAGDAFAGTVGARLALGDELVEAVRLGTAAAALALGAVGGVARAVTLEELRHTLTAA